MSIKKEKLPFGHYKVNHTKVSQQSEFSYNIIGTEKVVCKPLTQDDYANGWRSIIPRSSKNNNQPIHHWSVTLAQLPPHLWHNYKKDIHKDSNIFNRVICDGIYHYTITQTDYDEILIGLYHELQRNYNANKNNLHEYIKKLDGVNSWLIIRANILLSKNNKLFF